MLDVELVAGQVVPFLAAYAGVAGTKVLERINDKALDVASDATVGWGQRMLSRMRATPQVEKIDAVMTDVADNPDEDNLVLLHVAVRKALRNDPALAEELAAMVNSSGIDAGVHHVTITNSSNVIVGNHNNLHADPRP
jgi:hypothetical protein